MKPLVDFSLAENLVDAAVKFDHKRASKPSKAGGRPGRQSAARPRGHGVPKTPTPTVWRPGQITSCHVTAFLELTPRRPHVKSSPPPPAEPKSNATPTRPQCRVKFGCANARGPHNFSPFLPSAPTFSPCRRRASPFARAHAHAHYTPGRQGEVANREQFR